MNLKKLSMLSSDRGKFVSFEGGEGSGKSSLLSRIRKTLELKKIPVVFSHEPGGTEVGEEIRTVLLKSRKFFSARCEALLYSAGRAQHLEELIIPSLKEGKNVIVDRFVDASLAYQGVARDLGLKRIRDLNEWATQGIYPDRTYFLDVDPAVGFARAKGRNALDRIEQEGLEFHAKIRSAYQHLAQSAPGRYVVVDAAKTADEVFSFVERDLLGWLQVG